jgi:hypothetical protein
MGSGMDLGIIFRIENDLGNAPSVTQVNENDPAMVPAAKNPPGENHFQVHVVCP